MVNLDGEYWKWHHNISEAYYHIQLTIKYRKSVLTKEVEKVILEALKGFKERYAVEITQIGFDQNHIHILCRFLPKYSGGQVIRLIKSITSKAVFKNAPEVKKYLWGGELWTDGYYFATVSAHGDKKVIENYIKNEGRGKDVDQLTLFEVQ